MYCKLYIGKTQAFFIKGSWGIKMQGDVQKKSRFAANLSKLRREKGLSQRKAASELGISQALLSHYETDAREPKLDFVVKVCDYYSVTTDFILGRTKERGDGASKLSAEVNEIVVALEELRVSEVEILNRLKERIKG